MERSRSHYYLLRHGESVPNTKGIILSRQEDGTKEEYALTASGEEQVVRSAEEAKARGLLGPGTVIWSSPFSRCRRTAELARRVLGVRTDTVFDDRLRERWFGDWEGTSNENYQKVWDDDAMDADHRHAGVESAADVARRVTELVRDLERRYSGEDILLVSHGDALQILQTVFEGMSSSAHRSVPPLHVAEIRKAHGFPPADVVE